MFQFSPCSMNLCQHEYGNNWFGIEILWFESSIVMCDECFENKSSYI